MKPIDFLLIVHPAIAIISVFPLIGIVVYFAWNTRQRRLRTTGGETMQIPPLVGREHVKIGRYLSQTVVGVTLLGLAHPIGEKILVDKVWQSNPFQVFFILAMFALTIASLLILNRSRQKQSRGIFATLTGLGIVVLGFQEGVFRRDNEWFWSHFYFGMLAALLMIFSLAIVENIYQDRSNRWRYLHVTLNCLALLLFIGQGITGTRDLLEIGIFKLAGQ
jgi:uncharacterized membrane protein YozB (DUF420 family)